MNIKELFNKILEKQDLTRVEAKGLLVAMMGQEISPVQIAGILTALRMKGETEEEIAGFIEVLRENMLTVKSRDAVDVCGTGGDGKGTFNISTVVAFVLTGAGVKVAKHGNGAASSKCGSADVLHALGVQTVLLPVQAEEVLEKTGMVFLFAPIYHPAYKPVILVRKELGIRTVFNYLGPFCNPAGVKRQLIGVPNAEIAAKLARVAKKLHYEHLVMASSDDGYDEVSIFAPATIYEVKGGDVVKSIFDPAKYGLGGKIEDILGGEVNDNAQILLDILDGKKGAGRDMVLLNSAFGFLAARKVRTVESGLEMARESIDSGSAKRSLEKLIKESNKYEGIRSSLIEGRSKVNTSGFPLLRE